MSDELIYKVKLVADDKSLAELKKQVAEVEKQVSQSGRGRGSSSNEKEVSELKRLRQELSLKREQLAKINALAREYGGAVGALTVQQQKLGADIKSTNEQIQEANRGYTDQQTALSILPNTYKQLEEQNRALAIAMKDVPLDDTSGQLQTLQQRYAENNNRLKQFDTTIGNNQRNVGNYKSALDDTADSLRTMASGLAVVQGPLGPLAGRINSVATTLQKLKSTTDSTTKSFSLLRVAIAATGIGLLITAVASLTQFFTKSEEGQIRFRVIMAQISGITKTFRERAIALGKTISDMWSSPRTAVDNLRISISNLGNAIVANLVDRVKAIPDFFTSTFDGIIGTFQFLGAKIKSVLADVPIIGAGIDADKAEEDAREAVLRVIKATAGAKDALAKIYNIDFIIEPIANAVESFKELYNQAVENGKISRNYEEALQRELIVQRELSVERAKQAKQFQQAREFVRDTNNTLDERISKIREVNKAEKELLDQELRNERAILDIMQKQFDQFSSTKEEAQALAEQKIKVFNIEAQSSEKSMSALRDENALIRKQTELVESASKMQFARDTQRMEMQVQAEAFRLERTGHLIEAHLLRMEQIKENAEERKQRLIDELNAKGFQQQFSDAEISALAQQQVELEIAKETQEAKQKLSELEFENRMMMAQQLSSGLSALNSAFFKDSKELAVASAIVDTYAAVNKALSAPPGYPFNIAGVIAAGATGIANVKKIMSTKLGDKSVSAEKPQQPNITTGFGLVDVGTNAPIASQVAMDAGMPRGNMNPTFVFQGDLDPEIMAIKVNQGRNAISGNTIGIG
jgi:hypothetical protein